ncbi:glycosyltransferase family 9 protein [Aliiglaciecola sp. CAU 1673]|uniref:glycosyltransferase family 9 protein n=1 Tax=Aliiglaciecola sp. CAU 1673 TaxID=3032595 RepID=UPI0023DC1972|nr:glycosyltransferase family 9 protein [Aliiglaciecola sp. CAU 1673]MDF2179278.1 glycosyltransferase family 9 protein [Aliiglaciecola sp. CAU 1673]
MQDNSFPLVPERLLLQAKRVLYMTHLALGDFVYQRAYLAELVARYPQLSVDIWIDDCRSRHKAWHEGRNQTLVQWLKAEDHLQQIYPIARDKKHRQSMLKQAREVQYDLVVFIASTRSEQYARYARQIAPKAYVVGTLTNPAHHALSKWWYFRQLDGYLKVDSLHSRQDLHISDIYQQKFKQLLGLSLPAEKRVAPLNVEENALIEARDQLAKWTQKTGLNASSTLFINHLSTTSKRDYQWSQLTELLLAIQASQGPTLFVLNVPPAQLQETKDRLARETVLQQLAIQPFSASHFVQLPAMIAASDRVITVETAIMHLAACVGTPQVALLRDSATSWRPLGPAVLVYGKERVDRIPVSQVVEAYLQLSSLLSHKLTGRA